jgi:hypothetical protein
MIVEIDWFIIATCEPIGFDYFLNGLMTQEAYVKLMPCRIESLCSDNVFIYLFEPFEGYFFSCHFYLLSAWTARRPRMGCQAMVQRYE